MQAPVLDIGCGDDPLTPDCDKWDITLGNEDATLMRGAKENYYNTVYSSHLLEHLVNPVEAIQNWFRLVKLGGRLIISVPHRELYEKRMILPSLWNADHKHFYLAFCPEPPCTRGLAADIYSAIGKQCAIESLTVQSSGFVELGPDVHSQGEYSIEVIVRKQQVVMPVV